MIILITIPVILLIVLFVLITILEPKKKEEKMHYTEEQIKECGGCGTLITDDRDVCEKCIHDLIN